MIIYGGIQQNGIILSVHTKTVDTSLKRSIKKNIWKQDICATWILQFMISSCRYSIWKHCVNSPVASVSEFLGKEKLFPGTQREESQVARMGWSRVIRFSEVSFSEVCISVILSRALGQIKWLFCEGYEAGKIRDDLLHRGTVKPRGGGWRKSGEWDKAKTKPFLLVNLGLLWKKFGWLMLKWFFKKNLPKREGKTMA